jgi:hypothetical protein
MRFREAIPGVVILLIRLALVEPRRWPLDWIAVLSILWVAVSLTREETPARRWSVGAACAWLAVIYGVHQLPFTFAGWS